MASSRLARRAARTLAVAATLAALPPGAPGSIRAQQTTTPPAGAPQVDISAMRADAARAERAGRDAEAAALYRGLIAAQPDDPQWVVRCADALGRHGAVNDALDLLDEARPRFPDAVEIAAMTAKIFHLKADRLRASGVFDVNVTFLYEDARRTAEHVLTIQPDHVEARLLVASASFQLGDLERALTEARKVTADRPGDYGGHAMIGRILFQRYVEARQQGDDERAGVLLGEATAALERARRADRTRSFPVVKLADLAAWTGDLDKALELYGAALAIDPDSQVSHDWLRSAVDAGKRRALYGRAREAYAVSDGAKPRGIGLLRWYESQAAFDARDWKAAAEGFSKSLAEMPDYQDTRWWLMQSLFWGGDSAAAETVAVEFARSSPQRFADMIRSDDQTVATVVGMARHSYQSDRAADSRDLNRVIAYARQTSDAWNNYAFLCRETGLYEESARAYGEALNIEPDSPQLLNDAAVIFQYHLATPDNLRKARTYYERAIELAEKQIAAGNLDADTLELTRTALRDARNNLRRM
ncbi:MAG: hypothetical protein IPM29_23675 [Planctomycetes bacterium]|nr:hypothetical protein [Planctomycetota bacterium]